MTQSKNVLIIGCWFNFSSFNIGLFSNIEMLQVAYELLILFPITYRKNCSNKILQDKMQPYISIYRCIHVYIEPN